MSGGHTSHRPSSGRPSGLRPAQVTERVYTKGAMHERTATELTGRQRQVLSLVAKGRSNREIADELGITEQGVKSHVSRLLLRHGVANRTALVAATQSWRASDAAVYEAMDGAMSTVRSAVASHQRAPTNGNAGTNGHGNGGTNGHSNGPGRAADRLRRELSVETLRRQAAALSPEAPAEVRTALDRLREIVRELNVALEFARDLPPGDSSKVLVKAVSRRAIEAEKQVAALEGAITAARR
jgi:DNA-binding CsgD family transcriptional regulator